MRAGVILSLGAIAVVDGFSPSRFASLRSRCDRGIGRHHAFCANHPKSMTQLSMSEKAVDVDAFELDNVSTTNNEMQQQMQQVSVVDYNAYINIGVIAIVTVLALSKLATVDMGMMRGWTAAEMAVRIPVDNWASYESILHAAPISTKAVTSATVYTIGDIIAQRTEGKSYGDLDRWRVLRSLLAGCIGHGPLSHVWYDWSEDVFTEQFHWTEWWSFFPKVAIDQMTWGPFWNNTYILLLGIMQFRPLKDIWTEIKETTVPLIVSGLKLWPLAHCVTYGLVPVENRLLWVDLVEIVWVTILASAAAEASSGGNKESSQGENGGH
uniref:Peroxisomal membrane protein MPV17 n=1 Tax=Leptocylindrus danicus TaxID=163516 RepID=A0A7S2PLY5_9STRA|mmetsp:Transcript_5393/g.7910  ORF Transcript_5393/g.7910 Transcript_5393/m.7910 type:complete len:324 (+) Transcript_5393:116-1087(+)|eukprot:CAMPEP_0116034340 /NCGR_PEP_ID=MMETSP0321-20121206/19555_1 /TAXON_ID=163516 /ORGANISM="Leptocylindrus danicus var. danicus, Strain B650" /LENGTH=323 /DNA_ID=CAMNT_0003510645 /DNA_START=46 /DNA_END=1017 /DNA_ORIENTATION=+